MADPPGSIGSGPDPLGEIKVLEIRISYPVKYFDQIPKNSVGMTVLKNHDPRLTIY